MPRIYVLSGPDLGRTFEVGEGATFGRTTECAVPLRDASVSRTHARLERDGSTWRVVDAGSRNGIYVGTERVSAAELDDGDEFRLGEVLLRFRAEIAAIPPARVAAPTAPAPASEPEAPRAPEPEIRFETRGPSRPAPVEEASEIELEGDWDSAPTVREDRAHPRVVPPPAVSRPDRAEPSAATSAAPRSAANDERARKLAAAGIAAPSRGSERDARGVLQFHKVAQQDGVLRQDLAQQSTWVRTLVLVLVAAAMIALAWFGYQAATAAKTRLSPAETVENEDR